MNAEIIRLIQEEQMLRMLHPINQQLGEPIVGTKESEAIKQKRLELFNRKCR